MSISDRSDPDIAPFSALYTGTLSHRRTSPKRNEFTYPLFMVYLDLEELPTLFDPFWLVSLRRPAPVRMRRADYLGDPEVPLDDAVRDLVEERLGWRPTGPIRMLTHLRYFGFLINPVTFYYCFEPDAEEKDATDEKVEVIVAEVTNTPWGERYAYVLSQPDIRRGKVDEYHLEKVFHVSPFFEMDQRYTWMFSQPGEKLAVHMRNHQEGKQVFDATLSMKRQPMTPRNLRRALLRQPFMTLNVAFWIYWQAAKIHYWKRVPYVPYPGPTPKAPQPVDSTD